VRELESRYLDKVVMIARFRESKVVKLPGALTIIIVVSSGTNYLKPFCYFFSKYQPICRRMFQRPTNPQTRPSNNTPHQQIWRESSRAYLPTGRVERIGINKLYPNRAAAGGVGNHHLVCEQVPVRSDAFMMQTSIQ
jgi:hypothetical protein